MDECSFWVDGELRQARLFGENLALTRRIETWLGQNRFSIHDTVENLGALVHAADATLPHQPGLPACLTRACRLERAAHNVRPRDKRRGARHRGVDAVQEHDDGLQGAGIHPRPACRTTTAGLPSSCPTRPFIFGYGCASKRNPCPTCGVEADGQGAYVLGLEPSNCGVEGRAKDRARGVLQFLDPTRAGSSRWRSRLGKPEMANPVLVKKLLIKPGMRLAFSTRHRRLHRESRPAAWRCAVHRRSDGGLDFVQLFIKNSGGVWRLGSARWALSNRYGLCCGSAIPRRPPGSRATFDRDVVWKMLEPTGLRPVTQVAIDEVWSALRFRPAEKVKKT